MLSFWIMNKIIHDYAIEGLKNVKINHIINLFYFNGIPWQQLKWEYKVDSINLLQLKRGVCSAAKLAD